jgi:hypothetical protein
VVEPIHDRCHGMNEQKTEEASEILI